MASASRWMLVLAVAFCVCATPQDSQAAPLASADPAVEQGGFELVKKRRSADDDEEDEGTAAPRRRGGGGGSSSGGGGKGFIDYLKDAFTLDGPDMPAHMTRRVMAAWVLGALAAPIGGLVWVPMLVFDEAAPDSDGKSAALILGVLATVLFWIPGVFPFLIPLVAIYGLGGLLYSAWSAAVIMWIMPKAVMHAYADAYRSGGGGSSKRRRAPASDDE